MKVHIRLLLGVVLVALVGCTDSTSPGADLPQFASFEVRALDGDPAAASYGVRTLDVHPPISGSGQWYISPAPNLPTPPPGEEPDPSVFFMRASTYPGPEGMPSRWSSMHLAVAPGHDYPFQGGGFSIARLSDGFVGPEILGGNIGIAAGDWLEGSGNGPTLRMYRFGEGQVNIQKLDDITIQGEAQMIAHAMDEYGDTTFDYEGHPRTLQITAQFRLRTLPYPDP
jgi:hypothetical protein